MDSESCHRYCFKRSREPLPEKPIRNSQIKIVLFDMDGVLVDSISSWKHVHTYFSTNNDRSVDAYVKGLITDEEFIRRDVSQWKMDDQYVFREELIKIFSSLSLMNGAVSCVNSLKRTGVMLGIVSAGLDLLAQKVASSLGIDMVYANQLQIEKFDVSAGNIAAIGNSCFDIPLLRSVGLGIAFNPDDDCVVREADEVIYEKDLKSVLPILKPGLSDQKR